MPRGGARDGAGRKAFCSKTTAVHWRVSEKARDWITEQAEQQGVPKGVIIDALIESFEERISE